MVFWTTWFLSSFTELWKKKAYYEENSWIVYGVILRYQQDWDASARILQEVFTNALSLVSRESVTKQQLNAFAIKLSLLNVLAPHDIEMEFQPETDSVLNIWDRKVVDDDTLAEILWSLSLHERIFYNAVVIDKLPIGQISLWTWFSTSYIESIVNYTRNKLTQSINDIT